MPNKEWPINLTDQSKDQCRKQLHRVIDATANELLKEGWEPRCIAEALVELADDYMDTVICGTASDAHSARYH